MMNIYVGNLSYSATEDDLKQLFGSYGQVSDVHIISDRYTGNSRGFGFVEMESVSDAQAAIEDLNGKDFMNRSLVVNEARPKPQGRDRDRGGRDRRYSRGR